MQPTTLTQIIAAEQSRDRIAAAARAIASSSDRKVERSEPAPGVSLRRARPADADALAHLASLDGRGHAFARVAASWASDPELTVLLAEVDDEPAAALVVSSGTVLANPFQDTQALVRLMQVRRSQLLGAGRFGAHRSPVARLRSLVTG